MTKSEDNKVVHSATEELATIKSILFGEAQSTLEQKLSNLQSSLDQGLSSLKYELTDKVNKLHETIEQSLVKIEDKIQYVDSQHDTKNELLDSQLSALASEHESFSTNTETHLEVLNSELNKETDILSKNFTEQIETLKQELDKVSLELHSSKTDRKTLARLLATMATNLEDDAL